MVEALAPDGPDGAFAARVPPRGAGAKQLSGIRGRDRTIGMPLSDSALPNEGREIAQVALGHEAVLP